MSDSGLKLPATTELEVRVREALKELRRGLHTGGQYAGTDREPEVYRRAMSIAIRILEDGKS